VAAFLGLRVGMRVRLRQGMIIILGVLLGASFTPELLQRLGEWAVSLCVLTGMTMTGATLCYAWLRRVTDWDRVTCYFAAMPGGLNDMTIMGGAMGGQERAIALAHALRILTVVLTIPVWYRLVNGAQTSVLTMVHGPTGNDWKDYAILIACGVIGAIVGRLLRLPASFMMGPMIVSAIAHLGGFTNSQPPGFLVAAAQVVVGTGIGCRLGRRRLHPHRLRGRFRRDHPRADRPQPRRHRPELRPGRLRRDEPDRSRPRHRGRDGGDPPSVQAVPDHHHRPDRLPDDPETRARLIGFLGRSNSGRPDTDPRGIQVPFRGMPPGYFIYFVYFAYFDCALQIMTI
jgi:membrane AbrB-like protein